MADSFESLKAEFLAETEDTLANLQQDLRGLELAASGAPLPEDVVDRVFRTTHSLKGVAGMFGLDAMSALAHSLENVPGCAARRRFPLMRRSWTFHRGHEGLHAQPRPEAAGPPPDHRATGRRGDPLPRWPSASSGRSAAARGAGLASPPPTSWKGPTRRVGRPNVAVVERVAQEG